MKSSQEINLLVVFFCLFPFALANWITGASYGRRVRVLARAIAVGIWLIEGGNMTREETEAFYVSKAWRRKKKAILRRDHYQCQLCKRYGRLTEAKIVHHKLELAEYPELALDDDNLISVCRACHNKLHPEKAEARNKYKYGKHEDRYSGERMA